VLDASLIAMAGHTAALKATLDTPRRALLGEAAGSAGRDLLADAIECAKAPSHLVADAEVFRHF
jgi:hypothetical protein